MTPEPHGLSPHFWSPPTRLPADLPAHEQWARTMPFKVAGTPSPHPPQTAPGFVRAWNLGLCPAPVPEQPPVPLPGINAGRLLVLGTVVPIAVFILVFSIIDSLQPPGNNNTLTGASSLVMLVVSLATAATVMVSLRRFGSRNTAEHAAGYTTLAAQTGLWAINPFTGTVWRSPDRTVLPSGWYPSPYFPGVMQRWDGPDWAMLDKQWWHPNRVGQVFRGVGNVALDGMLAPGTPSPPAKDWDHQANGWVSTGDPHRAVPAPTPPRDRRDPPHPPDPTERSTPFTHRPG